MPTTTANLGLTLPTPNVDTGWGSTLNTDFTIIDNLFAAAGSGPSVGLNVGAGKTLNVGGTLVGAGTIILGSGDGTGTTTSPVIRGAARTGLNVLGAYLVIDAANGTGTGGSGDIVFRTAPPQASSSTPNTFVNKFAVGRDYVYAYDATAPAYDNTTKLATTAQVYSTVTTAKPVGISGNYTLIASDQGATVFSNAGAAVITVPTNASVAFPMYTRIDFVQLGAGQVSFAGAAGVTIYSSGSRLKLANIYSAATLLKVATDGWVLIGDLA